MALNISVLKAKNIAEQSYINSRVSEYKEVLRKCSMSVATMRVKVQLVSHKLKKVCPLSLGEICLFQNGQQIENCWIKKGLLHHLACLAIWNIILL